MRRTSIIVVVMVLVLGTAPPELVKVGDAAPPVVAYNIDGTGDMELYYRDFVLVTFWSLDDAASKRQFEQLKTIRKGLASESRLVILSVCTDDMDNWDRWRHFLEGLGKVNYGDRDRGGGPGPFDFYMDHKWVNTMLNPTFVNSARAYGVAHAPDAFLIGPDRKLLAVHIPTDKLSQTVTDALKKAR